MHSSNKRTEQAIAQTIHQANQLLHPINNKKFSYDKLDIQLFISIPTELATPQEEKYHNLAPQLGNSLHPSKRSGQVQFIAIPLT